ncbi:MAG: DUF2846 domain-containing protein [Burkholderiaceae bacterium]|nr:DUF2846 domain-containing protein [Burkholderiaceae bacterium]
MTQVITACRDMLMVHRVVQSLLVLALSAALIACSNVPMAASSEDARLKAFSVAPDQAGIYVFRDALAAGSAVKLRVEVDGAPLGTTLGGTYLFTLAAPGRHTVQSIDGNVASLELDVPSGTIAFVRQETRWGLWQAGTHLQQVGEDEGRRGVLAARLALSQAATQTVHVLVEAEDLRWAGGLECSAANSLGAWQFRAPGEVTVRVAATPLRITCRAGDGAESVAQASAPSTPRPSEGASKGRSIGAAVGAGAGAIAAAATAPVAGPALALLVIIGSALRGAEVGGVVGSAKVNDVVSYPAQIVLRVLPPR